MESAEPGIVSKEDGLFWDGLVREEKRILEVLRKAEAQGDRHMTKDRIAQQLGAYGHAVPGISRGIDGLRKKHLVIERIDPVVKESCYVLGKGAKKHDKGHRGKTADKHAKVKELYEEGKTYEEMSEELGIPRGTVASALFRMIKDGEVTRRNRAKGAPTIEPKHLKVELHDSEEEDDEPEVLEQGQPDVAEILKAFENGANEIRRMGWHVELQVKLSFPIALHMGAS